MPINPALQRKLESKLIENFGTSPEEAAKRAQLALEVLDRVKANPPGEKHPALQRARSNNQLDEQLMSAALTIAAIVAV